MIADEIAPGPASSGIARGKSRNVLSDRLAGHLVWSASRLICHKRQMVGPAYGHFARTWRRQMDEVIRRMILTLLDQHRIMTIATLRPDGWPQATTVGYVNEGLTLYFLCGPNSQKAANLARNDRVSLTIDHDSPRTSTSIGHTLTVASTTPGSGQPDGHGHCAISLASRRQFCAPRQFVRTLTTRATEHERMCHLTAPDL
jgi:hypothetical protein